MKYRLFFGILLYGLSLLLFLSTIDICKLFYFDVFDAIIVFGLAMNLKNKFYYLAFSLSI